MASKYGKLRGQVPPKPSDDQPGSERAQRLLAHTESHRGEGLAAWAEHLTNLRRAEEEIKASLKLCEEEQEAIEGLVMDELEGRNEDAVSTGGFTHSVKYEPYPNPTDRPGLLQYCLDEANGLRDALILPPARLAAIVREEAEANELIIETKTIQVDGQEVEVQEARSRLLPGVRVFLKRTLSRVKSRASA